MPGYIGLTVDVSRFLRRHWKTFLLLSLMYAVLLVFVGAITSQDTYSQISSLLKESGANLFGEGIGKIGEAGLLAVSAFATWPSSLGTDQQIYVALILLFVWLVTVWLSREFLQNRHPKLRDGLYNAGAPQLSTMVVLLVLIVQLLPLAIVALVYGALKSVSILDGGFGNMLFWVFTIAVATLSLYWITSTIIALVVVTLPGMYPGKALRISSDLVVGRRVRVMSRLLWGLAVVFLLWMIVIIPAVLLDTVVKSTWSGLANVPFVPYVGAMMSAGSVVWYATYVYLLYRRIVDDDAKPA